MIKCDPVVHSSAEIEPGAQVGHETKIWRHSHVRATARIGFGCTIGANVYVDAGVRIGNQVKIQNNVSVYAGVTLEDDVFVGPSAVFTNDLLPRATSFEWQIVPTRVGRGAAIGANATVVCGNDIGAYALVAAGAVVTHPIPAHALVMGNPARERGWVCCCGEIVSRDHEPPDQFSCAKCRNNREAIQ